jgi:hypothetical protein
VKVALRDQTASTANPILLRTVFVGEQRSGRGRLGVSPSREKVADPWKASRLAVAAERGVEVHLMILAFVGSPFLMIHGQAGITAFKMNHMWYLELVEKKITREGGFLTPGRRAVWSSPLHSGVRQSQRRKGAPRATTSGLTPESAWNSARRRVVIPRSQSERDRYPAGCSAQIYQRDDSRHRRVEEAEKILHSGSHKVRGLFGHN